jgi:hypothetical protein
MLSCLLIFFVSRQETDHVVFEDEAVPGKHPRMSLRDAFFVFQTIKHDDLLRCREKPFRSWFDTLVASGAAEGG